jgi:cell division septation protein DedD
VANIPEGFGIIAGRGKENAQKAIAAAIAANVDPVVVRTVAEGYLVPEKVLVEFEKANKAESKPKAKSEPKARAKKSAEKPAEKPEEAPAESESDKKEE